MHKKKMEFSKKILIVVAVISIIVVAYTLVMVAITQNLDPLNYLIPALFGEVATGTGFYYWKAKQENSIKLKKFYGESVQTGDDSFGSYDDASQI